MRKVNNYNQSNHEDVMQLVNERKSLAKAITKLKFFLEESKKEYGDEYESLFADDIARLQRMMGRARHLRESQEIVAASLLMSSADRVTVSPSGKSKYWKRVVAQLADYLEVQCPELSAKEWVERAKSDVGGSPEGA